LAGHFNEIIYDSFSRKAGDAAQFGSEHNDAVGHCGAFGIVEEMRGRWNEDFGCRVIEDE
jgi:hypothetical protein